MLNIHLSTAGLFAVHHKIQNISIRNHIPFSASSVFGATLHRRKKLAWPFHVEHSPSAYFQGAHKEDLTRCVQGGGGVSTFFAVGQFSSVHTKDRKHQNQPQAS